MRKFSFKIIFADVKNGNWWEEEHECRAFTYERAVSKALRRGQAVLRNLDTTNKNIFMRVCKERKV